MNWSIAQWVSRHDGSGQRPPGHGDPQSAPASACCGLDAGLRLATKTPEKITKLIRDEGPKGVKTQIQGDEVRVSSKKHDDLQAVIAMLKKPDLDVALQFVNYR